MQIFKYTMRLHDQFVEENGFCDFLSHVQIAAGSFKWSKN
jgi:hypothetical protein